MNNKEEMEVEDYMNLVDEKAKKNNTIDLYAYSAGVKDGVEWQAKRSYSEQEVRFLLEELSAVLHSTYPLESLDNWFEKNKKQI